LKKKNDCVSCLDCKIILGNRN